MARPRKNIHDDRYDEEALNHDLTPEQIRARSAAAEAAAALDAGHDAGSDDEAEVHLAELGEREDGDYFESLPDDESEDDL